MLGPAGRRRSNDGAGVLARGCNLGRHIRLRWIRPQIGQLQLELVEQRTALRGLAEPIVSQLPDCELELLDQRCPVLGLALRRRSSLFSRTQDRTLGNDERIPRLNYAACRLRLKNFLAKKKTPY